MRGREEALRLLLRLLRRRRRSRPLRDLRGAEHVIDVEWADASSLPASSNHTLCKAFLSSLIVAGNKALLLNRCGVVERCELLDLTSIARLDNRERSEI